MSSLEVLVDVRDRENEVHVKVVDDVDGHDQEDGHGCVLEVGELEVGSPELNSPADIGASRWWRLESH